MMPHAPATVALPLVFGREMPPVGVHPLEFILPLGVLPPPRFLSIGTGPYPPSVPPPSPGMLQPGVLYQFAFHLPGVPQLGFRPMGPLVSAPLPGALSAGFRPGLPPPFFPRDSRPGPPPAD